jgi:hypothetical protein
MGGEQFAPARSRKRSSIQLHIEELVLSGLDITSREQIAGHVQTKLSSKLSQHGLPQTALAASTRERIDGGTIALARSPAADEIGSEIARAVYGGLSAGSNVGGRESKKG